MNSLLSIGKMAEINDISIQRLRHYDKIGLLSPAYVKENSNYRYYDTSQCRILDTIQELQYMGLSLEEIKNLFEKDDLSRRIELLRKNFQELTKQEERIKRKKLIIQQYLRIYESDYEDGQSVLTLDTRYIYKLLELEKLPYFMNVEEYNIYRRMITEQFEKNNLSKSFSHFMLFQSNHSEEKPGYTLYLNLTGMDTTLQTEKIRSGTYLSIQSTIHTLKDDIATLSGLKSALTKKLFVEKVPNKLLGQENYLLLLEQ